MRRSNELPKNPNVKDFAMCQCHRVCAFLLIVLICNANRQFAVSVLVGIELKIFYKLHTAHCRYPKWNTHMQTHAHTHKCTHSNRMSNARIEEHSNIMPKTMSVWNTTILWLTDFIFLFLSLFHPLSLLNRFQFSWFHFTRARHVSRMDCVKIVGSHAQKILNCKVNESKETYNIQSAPQCF